MKALIWGDMAFQPIFLLSVPRSGSTLVQRIIAAHKGVATASEPWLLLPHAYAMRRRGVDAEYSHVALANAIEDFARELPGGLDEYRQELHDYIVRLYRRVAGNEARYFLDKSPYYLVAEEVMNLFPEGKFIFLWRNPLGIAASSMATWGFDWKPTMCRDELYIGLPRLVSAFHERSDQVHAVRFEDLSGGDARHWRRLMDFLEINFEPRTLSDFSEVELRGRMGDPTGTKKYATLSPEPAQKWKKAFGNPLRREWCRRYLEFLGTDRLTTMGYDQEQIIRELELQPTTTESLASDFGRMIKDVAKEPVRARTRNVWIGGPNVIRELLAT